MLIPTVIEKSNMDIVIVLIDKELSDDEIEDQEAAMVLIICLVLFIWALDGLCADYDHEAERRNDYRRAERRHQEKLEVMKKRKKVTRTVARDEHGRFVAQETVDYYDDDEEPDFEVD